MVDSTIFETSHREKHSSPAFQAQLDIAAESGHPVFLHQRDAHDDFVEVLEPMLPKLSRARCALFYGGRRISARIRCDGTVHRHHWLDLR